MNLKVGTPTLLSIVFMILKLCGVINWSWFWVFSPMIFTASLVVLILIIAFFIAGFLR